MTDLAAPAERSLMVWAAEAEAAAGIARSLARTAFIPDSLKISDERGGFDLDGTVAQVAAAILTGSELGLGVMASLRSIDVIPPGSGSPALRAAALRGLLQQRGHEIWVVESTDARAVVRGRRAGSEQVQESVWHIDRAKRMQLRGFSDSRSSWQKQPAAMLVARATAEVARWIASDALLGLPYVTEEIEDGAPDGLAPGDGAAQPLDPPAAPRRRTARRSSSQAPPAAAVPIAALPAAGAPSDGADQGAVDGAEAPAAPPPPKINAAQRAALFAGLKEIGLIDRADMLAAVTRWVGRDITSSNELTGAEANTALDAIKAQKARRVQDQAAEVEEGPPDDG